MADSSLKTPTSKETILSKKEYKIKTDGNFINIILLKTKNNIMIKSTFYEIKFNLDNFSLLTKILFKSIDEAFDFINNMFIKNNIKVKSISFESIKLVLEIYDNINFKNKEIEICLLENFENINLLIKDLFDLNTNLIKEISDIKEDNSKLRQENDKMKKEIDSLRDNYNYGMEQIKIQINNLYNQIMQLYQQRNNSLVMENQIMQQNRMQNQFNGQQEFFMNQNQIQMTQYNNNNIENQEKKMNIYFQRTSLFPRTITIICSPNDLISEVIQKYRTKASDNNKYFFLFNGKSLNENLTAGRGLVDGCSIDLISHK